MNILSLPHARGIFPRGHRALDRPRSPLTPASAARKARLALAFAFGAALACPHVSPAAAAGSKPNIVVILADDLDWSDLGCYG